MQPLLPYYRSAPAYSEDAVPGRRQGGGTRGHLATSSLASAILPILDERSCNLIYTGISQISTRGRRAEETLRGGGRTGQCQAPAMDSNTIEKWKGVLCRWPMIELARPGTCAVMQGSNEDKDATTTTSCAEGKRGFPMRRHKSINW